SGDYCWNCVLFVTGAGDQTGQEVCYPINLAPFSVAIQDGQVSLRALTFDLNGLVDCDDSTRRNLGPTTRNSSLPDESHALSFSRSFSQRFNCSASSAAIVSACFLLRPLPWPRTIPSQTTCETNVFSCSGPLSETNSYIGLGGEMLCNNS